MNVVEKISLLKGSLDIDLLEDSLGLRVIKQIGDEDICSCPLPSHDGADLNPSFSINRSKLVYHCFACNIGGNIIDLIARVRDTDYDTAYQFCRTYDDSTSGKDDPFAFGRKLESIFAQEAKSDLNSPLPRYSKSILSDWVGYYCDYFEGRGISEKSQDRFLLCYDENHKRGDYTGPAAIIPHFFEDALVGYQERWINEDRPKSIPKYTNTKGFPKAETLFGYDLAIERNNRPVVVVESALTAVYVDQIGYPAVATFGASISDRQISLLKNFSWGIILSFDNDEAGARATKLVAERLRKTVPTHIIDVQGKEKSDLNDFSEQDVVQFIENAKPWFMKGL
jgi:DNA primase